MFQTRSFIAFFMIFASGSSVKKRAIYDLELHSELEVGRTEIRNLNLEVRLRGPGVQLAKRVSRSPLLAIRASDRYAVQHGCESSRRSDPLQHSVCGSLASGGRPFIDLRLPLSGSHPACSFCVFRVIHSLFKGEQVHGNNTR